MQLFRKIVASAALVGAFFIAEGVPRPWFFFLPAAAAVLIARAVGPVSFSFTVVALTLLGPVSAVVFLFLISGDSHPGADLEYLLSGLSGHDFVAILAPPFVGAAVWLMVSYLTRRSSGPLTRPLN